MDQPVLLRPLEPEQYLSIRYTERLAAEGAIISVGSRGDSYDNAMAESVIGLYKAELITLKGPWRTVDDVELGTLGWVDWWNTRRLHSALEYLPPAEFEALYGAQSPHLDRGGITTAEKTEAEEPFLELSGSN
jgi:transposase InsO family protein